MMDIEVNQNIQNLSGSIDQKTKKNQSEQLSSIKTNYLLHQTLGYLNKNKELQKFKRNVVVPNRKNVFVDKKQAQKKSKNSKPSEKTQKNATQMAKEEHSIYDTPPRGVLKLLVQRGTQSIAKIKRMQSQEQRELIIDDKLRNENYAFLNILGKQGVSRPVNEFGLPQSENIEEQGYSEQNNNSFLGSNYRNSSHFRSANSSSLRARSLPRQKIQKEMTINSNRSHFKNERNTSSMSTLILRRNQTNAEADSNKKSFMKLIPVKSPGDSIQTSQFSLKRQNPKQFKSPSNLLNKPRANNSVASSSNLQDKPMQEKISQIEESYSEEGLYQLLSAISKEYNKEAIRIYKDDFRKIFSFRYGNDRITGFFDFEYIEDHPSLNKMLSTTVIKMSKQQILLTAFLMLDIDHDGLISHSDLFKLLLATEGNQLIKRNVYHILGFVKDFTQGSSEMHSSAVGDRQTEYNKGFQLRDLCLQNEEFLKGDGLTLTKFRFMNYMKNKQKEKSDRQFSSSKSKSGVQSRQLKRQKNTKSIKDRLFTFKALTIENFSKESDKILKTVLSSVLPSKIHPSFDNIKTFSINFTRFKELYDTQIPEIYYDMLYSAFGVKIQGLTYSPLDFQTPLAKHKKTLIYEPVPRLKIIEGNMAEMRRTFTDLSTEKSHAKLRAKTVNERRKRVRSLLVI